MGKPGTTSQKELFTSGFWVVFALFVLLFGHLVLGFQLFEVVTGGKNSGVAQIAASTGLSEITLWILAAAAVVIDILIFFSSRNERKEQDKKKR